MRRLSLLYLVVFGLVLLLWILSASPWPQPGDSAEFVAQGALGGVVHPPGYPLATLLFWLTARLPGMTPAWWAAAANALVMLGALVLLRRTWGQRRALHLLLVAWVASTPLVWQYALTPEAFSGLLCFASLFVLVFHRPELYRRGSVVLLLALSMLHHHTIVFLLPLLGSAAWAQRRDGGAHARALVAGASALLLYGVLYLFIFDGTVPGAWRSLADVGDVAAHFLRADYGSFVLQRAGAGAPLSEKLLFVTQALAPSLLGVGLVVGSGWGNIDGLLRRRVLALVGLALLIAVGFTALANLSLLDAGQRILARFLLLPLWLAFAGAGVALAGVTGTRARLVAGVLSVLVVSNVVAGRHRFTGEQASLVARVVKQTLHDAPPDSELVLTTDSAFFIARYFQAIEGTRPDLRLVSLPKFVPREEGPAVFDQLLAVAPGRGLERRGFVWVLTPQAGELRFDCSPASQELRLGQNPFTEFDETGVFALRVGSCQLLEGQWYFSRGDVARALSSWEAGLALNPWHPHLRERRCQALQRLAPAQLGACEGHLDELLATLAPEYLGFKFALPGLE